MAKLEIGTLKTAPFASEVLVERSHQDGKNMLITWMADEKTTKWSEVMR